MHPKPIPQSLLEQILCSKSQRRFWSKVRVGEIWQCWPWIASKKGKDGYGQFGLRCDGKTFLKSAHKIAWIYIHKKDVPEGLYVLHSCKANKACCNPAHLKLGTHQDNMNDMVEQGRCGLTGSFGTAHPTSKLTESKVVKIRSMYVRNAVTAKALAMLFGTTKSNVYSVLKRDTWQHI